MSIEGGRRLAIVVATTDYDDPRLARLAAPLSDALELARTLGQHGSFEVESLVNAEAQTVQRRLEKFCKAGRQRSDLLFVYLTGHGVKDEDGNLYFALRATDRDLLRTTALSAELLSAILNESPADSQVLMLDCCYSGAIARALRPKGDSEVDIGGTFGGVGLGGGKGRVVLAASGAIEQAWEGERGSIYTHAVVEGIATGAADLDGDGRITASDLHAYVAERLRTEGRQSPRKFEFDEAGDLVVARPGQQPADSIPTAPVLKVAQPVAPPQRPSNEARTSPRPKEPKRRGAPIAGMVAAGLAAVLATLWLTGAIESLPSPFNSTTTAAAASPTTTVADISTTVPTNSSTTADTGTTEAITAPSGDFQLVFEDTFSSNDNGWAEGDFSDANANYFFGFSGGAYEAGYSGAPALTYYSLIFFAPATDRFDVETEVTSLQSGSLCGLAVQGESGSLLTVAMGEGQTIARLYADGILGTTGFWEIEVEPNETRFALGIDGSSVTILINDVEVDTFEEPAIVGVSQIGVAVMGGGNDTYCSYDYLQVWES